MSFIMTSISPPSASFRYPYPSNPWFTRGYAIGGGGGEGFVIQEFDRSGKVVKKLGVHYDSWCLKALRVTYNDDTVSETVGGARDSYKEIILAPGERVTSASLWGNGIGTRTGRIRFETDKGQAFDAGKDTSGQTEYPMDVGSGILAGFAGSAGHDIDCLSFIFLRLVDSVELTNVRYEQPSSDTIHPTSLAHETKFSNLQGKEPLSWTFANKVERTEVTSFTSETTMTFGMDVKVTAGISEIASVEAGFHWEVGVSQSTTASSSVTVALEWGISGVLQPGKEVICQATAQYGNADIKYSATVTLKFNNGAVKKYDERGVLHNTRWAFTTATHRGLYMTEGEEGKMLEGKLRKGKSQQLNGNEDVMWVKGYPDGAEVEGQTSVA